MFTINGLVQPLMTGLSSSDFLSRKYSPGLVPSCIANIEVSLVISVILFKLE